MGQWQCVFGLLAVAVICVQKSSAISCYDCNSVNDKRCLGDENNKLTDDMKKPCPERKGKPYSLCRKIKQVIDFEVNGLQPDNRVIRTCGYEDSAYNNKCYQRSGFGGRQEVCACESDDCNSSSTIFASLSLTFSVLLMKLYF
ncbi:UPAR/Ly6 domain-containing protein crok [Diabrotica undecimpunctata]|uniref:UPAR/Ly6 domain-containing protein crok n=1 Tax=Diabrotica undecimpunctata TaxID=50387 RepID=UPI003B6348C5